jgi:methionyl-tRNA formyltransferase
VGTAALEGLLETGVEVAALYTYPQGADEGWFQPPKALARARGIPVLLEPAFNTDAVFEAIRRIAPDFLFSFYFREMIQARFLELPRRGCFNLHGSLLPKYRGRAPINWVLVNGETETGVTLHAMTPKPDDGDIVGQTAFPIAWDDTALTLTTKAAAAGKRLVQETVPRLLDGTGELIPQAALGPSSYWGGRKPSDSRLDFGMTARQAFNQIRAVADPWPNAFLETDQGTLKLAWALPATEACPPGHFRMAADQVLLGFADGALALQGLRRGDQRSERPSDHAAWLAALGIPLAG